MSTAEDVRQEREAPARSADAIGAVLLAGIPLAAAALLAGLALTGALLPRPIGDPGLAVTAGLPVARLLADGSAAVTIGLLILATFALPGQREVPGVVSFSQWSAVRWAAIAAGVWVLSGSAVLVLTAADVMGAPLGSELLRDQLWYFATGLELGQQLLVSVLLAAGALVASLLARRIAWVAVATALAVAALLPLALSGHAAGATEHGNAVSSMAIHLVAVTAWLGGLVALLLLRRRVGDDLGVVAGRYSVLAGWAFFAVVLSGTVNAYLRLGSPANLLTEYGLLVLAKTVLLVALGLAGIRHRRALLPRLRQAPGSRRAFLRLAAGEVLLMAVAMGLSVALSRAAPPVGEEPAEAFLGLVGYPEPPPVTPLRMLTEWHPDLAFLLLAGVLATTYVVGVRRLRARGDAWPLRRTVPFLLGCLALVYVTSGGPGVYGPVSFSTHMIQHMGLMMLVPPLLVLGAPVLLALRALPARQDGSRGIREWMLVLVHSRVAGIVSNPVVAAVIFAGSLPAFYYSGWFPFSLSEHQGHVLMVLHFLLGGYLFFWVLIGEDPGPKRASPPLRLLVLLMTLAAHAFFGLALMTQEEVLALDWWHALGYTDDAALLEDQRAGGGFAWGAGEVPGVLAAMIVVRQWVRSEARVAKRSDRAAERDGDAELNAYNARLASLADRDRRG
ncbi:cytochrome c oxidase assembly protein [Naasia sp. SYSU D00948]|uniref:cytochrome c oxidase assembly protein n=1 Tax=Naasia sp. SYSU D00948 TaxID=2817379 RepID=UPI0027DD197E|nr:cytochrome c oxidase assembly protein [Naasia sp. SYSU D00948]